MGDEPASNRKGLGIRDALDEKRNLHLRAAREKAKEILEEIDVKNGMPEPWLLEISSLD
jgi:hypothetical protein